MKNNETNIASYALDGGLRVSILNIIGVNSLWLKGLQI